MTSLEIAHTDDYILVRTYIARIQAAACTDMLYEVTLTTSHTLYFSRGEKSHHCLGIKFSPAGLGCPRAPS